MTTTPAETEAKVQGIKGTIAGVEVTVPPVKVWRGSALDALTEGRFSAWADKVLSDDDYDKWLDADPTVGEIESFFEEIGPSLGMGDSVGESRASRRSSRSTRKS